MLTQIHQLQLQQTRYMFVKNLDKRNHRCTANMVLLELQENHEITTTVNIVILGVCHDFWPPLFWIITDYWWKYRICTKSSLCTSIKCRNIPPFCLVCASLLLNMNFWPFDKLFLFLSDLDPLCMKPHGYGMTQFIVVSLLYIYGAAKQWLWSWKPINMIIECRDLPYSKNLLLFCNLFLLWFSHSPRYYGIENTT